MGRGRTAAASTDIWSGRRDADGGGRDTHCFAECRGEGAGTAVAVDARHPLDRLPRGERLDRIVEAHTLAPRRKSHLELTLKQARKRARRSARRRSPIFECPVAVRV